MCSGHVSTSWIKEELELNKHARSYNRHFKPSYRTIDMGRFKDFFNDKEAFHNLKFVALRGGEPFVEELNFILLEFLIESGIAKNISLDISTNGTVYDERLESLLPHFKSVELYISLEGTGKVYEYIRGDDRFTFQQLEENIKKFRKLENTTIIFAVTIMAYNIFEINNIWDWYLDFKESGEEISFSNIVVNPAYLDYRILPQKLREKAASKLSLRDYPGDNYFSGKRWIGDIGIHNFKKTLTRPPLANECILMQQFKEFTNDLDKIRHCNITEYINEFNEIFS
jgi:MoaA/NifB/PqqE/SkfB family radical SAM enzyme